SGFWWGLGKSDPLARVTRSPVSAALAHRREQEAMAHAIQASLRAERLAREAAAAAAAAAPAPAPAPAASGASSPLGELMD
ncbi:hypothetical protein E8E12_000021, partial [Didymella heteroderae]